jgi:dihydrofolate reductase
VSAAVPVALVVAMDRAGLIGANGALPWYLPADLHRFRAITAGHPIVMGRRTHESIGGPLPERHNIVVTRAPGYAAAGCTIVSDLAAAYAAARRDTGDREIMIIGGAALYREALPDATRIYLTEVHATLPGDVHFPRFDRSEWREISREDHGPDARNAHGYSFVVLERRPIPDRT